MIVIGTAGHIDHGKSSIVRRLTGTDPDRLPEEKARGLTIDLGFAFLDTSKDRTIAFVDVPGHERFVKNMIAGAGGIDAVMLVVAADDGWMPQSEEHFQIVRLLGVRHGLIVVNKADLVEPDWLDLLTEEIRERTGSTFLEQAPIVTVSATTGSGFEQLQKEITTLAAGLEQRRDFGKARLFIDRSFMRPGLGTVVTGTLRGGSLQVGQSVSLWPGRQTVKVRTLHSNNQEVVATTPGQRTAVSFTGAEKEWLTRGGVVSARHDLTYYTDRPVLALHCELLNGSPIELEDRRRLLLIVGTTEVEGEVRLHQTDKLGPGESSIVYFKPDQPIYALVGDHFIARLPTPMITVGGGRVLDHLEHVPRRRDRDRMVYLDARIGDDIPELIRSELLKSTLVKESSLLEHVEIHARDVAAAVARMLQAESIGRIKGYLYDNDHIQSVGTQVTKAFTAVFDRQSHLRGLSVDQISDLLGSRYGPIDGLLACLVAADVLLPVGELYDIAGRGVELRGLHKQAYDEIMKAIEEHPYDPPGLPQLARTKAHQQAIKYILETKQGYKVGADFLFSVPIWNEIVGFLKQTLTANGRMRVPELRDRFGFTRKYAIPILEETDRLGITKRDGDVRVKGDRFEG